MDILCAMDKQLGNISKDIWQQFELICQFLKPFAKVIEVMSESKYPTMASVILLFNWLCNHLDDTIDKHKTRDLNML